MITLNNAPSTWLCRWWSRLNSCRASTVWSWAIKMRCLPQRENVWSSTMLNMRWYVFFGKNVWIFRKLNIPWLKIVFLNLLAQHVREFWSQRWTSEFQVGHPRFFLGVSTRTSNNLWRITAQFPKIGANSQTNFHNPQHLDDPRLKNGQGGPQTSWAIFIPFHRISRQDAKESCFKRWCYIVITYQSQLLGLCKKRSSPSIFPVLTRGDVIHWPPVTIYCSTQSKILNLIFP